MLNGKGNGEVVALGFSAGFIGAAAVLLTATIVFYCGIGPALGVTSPISLRPPDVYSVRRRRQDLPGSWRTPLCTCRALRPRRDLCARPLLRFGVVFHQRDGVDSRD
jgi:hypothetical protein